MDDLLEGAEIRSMRDDLRARRFLRIDFAKRAGDQDKALCHLDAVLEENPQDVEALEMIVEICLLDEPLRTKEGIEEALAQNAYWERKPRLEIEINNHELKAAEANIAFLKGYHQRGANELTKILTHLQSKCEAAEATANTKRMELYRRGEDAVQRLMVIATNRPETNFKYGRLLLEMGDYEGMNSRFKEALGSFYCRDELRLKILHRIAYCCKNNNPPRETMKLGYTLGLELHEKCGVNQAVLYVKQGNRFLNSLMSCLRIAEHLSWICEKFGKHEENELYAAQAELLRHASNLRHT